MSFHRAGGASAYVILSARGVSSTAGQPALLGAPCPARSLALTRAQDLKHLPQCTGSNWQRLRRCQGPRSSVTCLCPVPPPLAGLVAWQKRQQKPCAPGIQNAPASAMLQDVCAYLSIRTNKETGSPTGAPKPAPAASMVLASSDAHVWPATPNRDAISEPSLCAWPAAAMVPPSLLLDSKDACASTPAPVRSTSLFDQMSTCPVPGPITPAERAPRPLVRAMSGPLADVSMVPQQPKP